MPVFTPYTGSPRRSTSRAAAQRRSTSWSSAGAIAIPSPPATRRISAGSRSSGAVIRLGVMSAVAHHRADAAALRPAQDQPAHGDVHDGQAPAPAHDPLAPPPPAR